MPFRVFLRNQCISIYQVIESFYSFQTPCRYDAEIRLQRLFLQSRRIKSQGIGDDFYCRCHMLAPFVGIAFRECYQPVETIDATVVLPIIILGHLSHQGTRLIVVLFDDGEARLVRLDNQTCFSTHLNDFARNFQRIGRCQNNIRAEVINDTFQAFTECCSHPQILYIPSIQWQMLYGEKTHIKINDFYLRMQREGQRMTALFVSHKSHFITMIRQPIDLIANNSLRSGKHSHRPQNIE